MTNHHDRVEELWPHLPALKRFLDDLPREVTIVAKHADKPLSEHEIDRIHEGLLRKKRSGHLGLND